MSEATGSALRRITALYNEARTEAKRRADTCAEAWDDGDIRFMEGRADGLRLALEVLKLLKLDDTDRT